MSYNPGIHHRRSIRLKDYDYSQKGAYFVTVCSWNRECLFGDIVNGGMRLNEYGRISEKEWQRTGVIRQIVELDAFVIMPNHIHGIIVSNNDVGERRCLAHEKEIPIYKRAIHRIAPTKEIRGAEPGTIGAILGQFKSIVTKQINTIRETPGVTVWQRNYYEHIIRNEDELNRIGEYIIINPLRWAEDENNPVNLKGLGCGSKQHNNKQCRGDSVNRP